MNLFCTECCKRPVQGFLLDGFHMNGLAAESLSWAEIQPVLAATVCLLPPDKPRFFWGAARPDLVFGLVGEGVDVFDSSYPCLVTEREAALVFPNRQEGGGPEDEMEQERAAGPQGYEISMRDTKHR